MSFLIGLRKLARGLWRWALDNPMGALALWFAGIVLFHALVLDPGLVRRIERAQAATAIARSERDAEIAAHLQTKNRIVFAEQEAARKERERLQAVLEQQKENADAALDQYHRGIAAARQSAQRLRNDIAIARAAADRAPGSQPVPALPAGAAGTAAAPGEGLPSDDIGWRQLAQEQAEQLDALITFVIGAAAIDPNAPGAVK